jgi:flagellar hook-associated protein 1 FlgK
MASINTILDIGRWSLHAQQMGVSVTAHNIANVNTPGYSRQILILEPAKPQDSSPGQLGRGVRPVSIERVYDHFLATQLRRELGTQGNLSTQASYFRQLEAIYSGLSDSDLGAQFQNFWSAWEELSLHPEGSAQKVALKETALELTSRLNGLHSKLVSLRDQLNRSLAISVQRVNELTSQIAELNLQIARSKGSGQNPNDLKDMRDKALDELAGLLNVDFWEADDGTMWVMGPGGMALVMGTNRWELEVKETSPGIQDVLWTDSHGNEVMMTDHISSGSMAGILGMRDRVVLREMDRLDSLARELIWEVNTRVSRGAPLSPFSSLQAEVQIEDPNAPLFSSNLPYAERLKEGTLTIWLYDSSSPPNPVGKIEVQVDSSTTLEDIVGQINASPENGGKLVAEISQGFLRLDSANGYGFLIGEDTSSVCAFLGLNVFFRGSSATDISVSQHIQGDPSKLGAAWVDPLDGTFSPGDNRVVLDVLDLRDSPLAALQGHTFEGMWASAVAGVGVEAAASYRTSDYQDAVVAQLEEQRTSVSGVNLDEEMVKLLEYQWAYQAAARLIQTSREMLQTVMSILE